MVSGSCDGETQNLDDYSPSELENMNSFEFQSTIPLTDTVPIENETQVLEDLEYDENARTQVLVSDEFEKQVSSNSDGEETDGTEVLSDAQRVEFGDESERRLGDDPVGEKVLVADSNASTYDKTQGSGSIHQSFMSVRTASLRASGLAAARKMTPKRTNTDLGSILNNGQYGKDHVHEDNRRAGPRDPISTGTKEWEDDWEHDNRNCSEEIHNFRGENRCRRGPSAARKLFTEDVPAPKNGSINGSDNINGGNDLPELLTCNHTFAGLSYLGSQEPGELSQANALNIVDRFISVNDVELSQEVDPEKTVKEKSPPVSTAMGPQSLVQIAKLTSLVREAEIFDWVDSREDEGGGDFFSKRKDVLFGGSGSGRTSFTQPQKPKQCNFRRGKCMVDKFGEKEGTNVHQKIMGLTRSDSRLMLYNLKEDGNIKKIAKSETRKNLSEELDEQLNLVSSDQQCEVIGTSKDSIDAVGIDTQMAAEAMEALVSGPPANLEADDTFQDKTNVIEGCTKGITKNKVHSKHVSIPKRASSDSGRTLRSSKRRKILDTKLSRESLKHSKNPKRGPGPKSAVITKGKKGAPKAEQHLSTGYATTGNESSSRRSFEYVKEKKALSAIDKAHIKEADKFHSSSTSKGKFSFDEGQIQEDYRTFTPVALRTRHSLSVNPLIRSGNSFSNSGKGKNDPMKVSILGKNRRQSSLGVDSTKPLTVRRRTSLGAGQIDDDLKKNKPSEQEPPDLGGTCDEIGKTSSGKGNVHCYLRGRTRRTLSDHLNKASNLDASSVVIDGEEANGSSITERMRSKINSKSTAVNLVLKRKTRSSAHFHPASSSLENKYEGIFNVHGVFEPDLVDVAVNGSLAVMNEKMVPKDLVGTKTLTPSGKEGDTNSLSSAKGSEGNGKLDESPRVNAEPSGSACVTPTNCTTPINAASPVCVGNDYHKKLCNKSLSRSRLMRELIRLDVTEAVPTSALKDLRKRRDMSNVRVLFSHHLDDDIIKKQKKILARLGASIACSSSEATHFVTDKFVRTRNMLEAIALGKPVVTHLWLKSCEQASCFIDEKNYILRDSKKEKEIGFSMPVSLARSCQSPLLQGKRVFITPNVKPGKQVITSLVNAVQGQVVERIGRSVTKEVPDDLLVLSCEEDYAICVFLLEKGAAVYSSELILNGIVIQRLEYDRHTLFSDNVKRTRSTTWLRKDGDQFLPVSKSK